VRKSNATLSPKESLPSNTKKSQKLKWKDLIHSIWTSDEKVLENLVLVAIKALSSKNNL